MTRRMVWVFLLAAREAEHGAFAHAGRRRGLAPSLSTTSKRPSQPEAASDSEFPSDLAFAVSTQRSWVMGAH